MNSANRRRDAALTASFLLLETLAFYVVAAVFASGDNQAPPPFLCFLAATAGGYALARALRRLELPNGALVAIGGLISALALTVLLSLAFTPLGFPPEGFGRGAAPQVFQLIGAALLVAQWARATLVAQRRVERVQAGASFSIGTVVLALGLLFGQSSSARDAVNGAAIPLVASGLLTLALVHQRDAQELGGEGMRGPWLSITVGSVVGLAFAGVALGVLPLGPLGWLYDHTVSPALTWIFVIIVWVSLIASIPFLLLFGWLISTLSGGRVSIPAAQIEDTSQVQRKVTHAHQSAVLAALTLLLKVAFVLIAVAAAAYLAYRLFGRLKHDEQDVDEERDTMEAEGSLLGDLAALLRGLRPRRAGGDADGEPDLPAGVLAARRLYFGLLDRAAGRGTPRPSGATPDEFEPALERALATPLAARATAAFAAARYGLIEPPAEELRRMQDEAQALE